MSSPRASVLLPVVVALTFGLWVALRPSAAPPRPEAPAEAEETVQGADLGGDAPGLVPPGSAAPSAPASPRSELVFDRAKRAQIRDLLWRALGEKEPDPAPPSAPGRYVLPDSVPDPPGDAGTLDPRSIRERVRHDFFGVARQCYGDALKRDRGLEGEITLRFAIVGNANIGGIVESVDVLNQSTLRDPEMIDCLRDQFLSVTFPPPEGGGWVTVTYPIVFSPEDDDGGS